MRINKTKTYKEECGNKGLMALVSSIGVKHMLGHRNVLAYRKEDDKSSVTI